MRSWGPLRCDTTQRGGAGGATRSLLCPIGLVLTLAFSVLSVTLLLPFAVMGYLEIILLSLRPEACACGHQEVVLQVCAMEFDCIPIVSVCHFVAILPQCIRNEGALVPKMVE